MKVSITTQGFRRTHLYQTNPLLGFRANIVETIVERAQVGKAMKAKICAALVVCVMQCAHYMYLDVCRRITAVYGAVIALARFNVCLLCKSNYGCVTSCPEQFSALHLAEGDVCGKKTVQKVWHGECTSQDAEATISSDCGQVLPCL